MGRRRQRLKEKNKPRRRLLFAALCVLGALLLALAALAWRFRAELRAYAVARRSTPEQLGEQLDASDRRLRDTVAALPEVEVRAPTEEERAALQNGDMSREELIGRLAGGPETTEAPSAPSAPETPPPADSPETSPPPADTRRLAELLAEVYVLREEYTAALDAMEAAAKADYAAIPADARSAGRLTGLVVTYLDRAAALERECDARMDAIVAEMEAVIAAGGGDETLPSTVFDTYVNEKSLKKAWYMSRLQQKGLI